MAKKRVLKPDGAAYRNTEEDWLWLTAYDCDGQLLGVFQDKQAAVEAITAAST